MSDCAIVIFHSRQQREVSPAVYLHMHGGCVLAFLEISLSSMRTGDAGYSCARFVGVCHEAITPNTGLGLHNLPGTATDVAARRTTEHFDRLLSVARKFDWGGRGIFLVDVDKWQVEHEGSLDCPYGDVEDGFGLQDHTELTLVEGVVQLPAEKAGT